MLTDVTSWEFDLLTCLHIHETCWDESIKTIKSIFQ